jgi:hypothetical protein
MEKKVAREPGRREAKKVIAATNNHYKGQAAVNAIDLKRLLGVKENPIPDGLLREYPRLKGGGEEARKSSSTQPTSKGNQAREHGIKPPDPVPEKISASNRHER